MLETITGALLPSVVTVFLGYLAGRRHPFGSRNASGLNRFVMTYALPLAIFSNVATASRLSLLQNLPLIGVLAVTMIGFYGVVFALCRYFLDWTFGMSALGALAASTSNVPFIGSADPENMYGTVSGIAIASSAILIALTVLPVTMLFLVLDANAGTAVASRSIRAGAREAILTILKEPVIWLPLGGFLMVLSGVSLPEIGVNALSQLGQFAVVITLFTAGVFLAAHPVKLDGDVLFLVFTKNIVQPMLVLGCLLVLGCANPFLGEAVVTVALPSIVPPILLATKYRVAEAKAASVLLFSTIASFATLVIFLVLTGV